MANNVKKEFELYESTKRALEYTVPIDSLIKKGKKYLTRNELLFVYDFAFKMDGEIRVVAYEIIKEYCLEKINKSSTTENICELEFFISMLASDMGDRGDYEHSNQLSEMILKECLINRRMIVLSDVLYNKIWNEQKQMPDNKQIDNKRMIRALSRCALLCKISKRHAWQAFFQNKIKQFF